MKNIKILFTITIIGLFILTASGQSKKPDLYNPQADAKKEIADAVKKAKAENKHVLIQVGGNW